LLHRDSPSEALAQGVRRGLSFYDRHATAGADGTRCLRYPGDAKGSTGSVAVVALAIVDGLEALGAVAAESSSPARAQLDGYLEYLERARNPEGLWHCCYEPTTCKPFGDHSPYYDGESLLALVKAAKRLDQRELEPLLREAAAAGHQRNVVEALRADRDSDVTKGYYQWSSMAFYELYTTGWPDTEVYGDWVLELADWMVDVHNPLARARNTGYSLEGLTHAYDVAKRRGDAARQDKYACVIDTILEQLSSWQVGNPLANRFIRSHPTSDEAAVGGVQNEPDSPLLRIDVTQHQLHGVLLARRYLYP
jgi:hypothetical protein